MQYPSYFACPMIEGYQGVVDYGLTRTEFGRGNFRQRRTGRKREIFSVTFAMPILQLWDWQGWVNTYGYYWIQMPMVSHLTEEISIHTARFCADLNIEQFGVDMVKVKTKIELDFGAALESIFPSGIWINAKYPAAPPIKWIIANTPASPASPDWVIAGRPGNPAA